MKLRNKKIGKFGFLNIKTNEETWFEVETIGDIYTYSSLAGLNAEWEDYKEPKERWYINENGGVLRYIPSDPDGEDLSYMNYQEQIGNYFETKEEAEKAVEKIKAWKRLKDKGFKFTGNLSYGEYYGCGSISFSICPAKKNKDVIQEMIAKAIDEINKE